MKLKFLKDSYYAIRSRGEAMSQIEISDRTDRLLKLLHPSLNENSMKAFSRFDLTLTGNKDVLSTYNGQVMALGAINQLARIFPNVRILIPAGIKNLVSVPFGQDIDLSQCAENIKQMIQRGLRLYLQSDEKFGIMISVGKQDLLHSDYEIVINSDGWHSYVCAQGNEQDTRLSEPSKNANPIGALSATSLAVAEAFRKMLELLGSSERRTRKKYTDLYFSTLDFSVNESLTQINPYLTEVVDLREITLVGAGAVSNGLMFALFLMQNHLKAKINVVDYQKYSLTDLNRCLMIEMSQVPGAKATEISSPFLKLSTSKIIVKDYVERYEESELHKQKLEFVISTVDENPPRLVIQSDLPRILLHGATGEEISTISRHDFLNGACLGCLFFEKDNSLTTKISNETGLDDHYVERLLIEPLITESDIVNIAGRTKLTTERLSPFLGKPFLELYAQEICGVITTQVDKEAIAASASFVSALTGTLLAGELLKEREENLAKWHLNNHLSMSVFDPSKRWLHERPKDDRCSCFCSSKIMVDAYKEKWLAGIP